jgi:hypothetical protein
MGSKIFHMRFLLCSLLFITFTQSLSASNVDAAIGDVFMQRKDCKSAEEQYIKELARAYNPFIASNLAVAKICLRMNAEAETILRESYVKMSVCTEAQQQAITMNYSLILNINKKYSESSVILRQVNPEGLDTDKKATYYAVDCENNLNFDRLDQARLSCEKSISIKKDCYNSLVTGRIFSLLKLFTDAEKTLEYTYSNCRNEDSAYYYSFALFGAGKKDKALQVLREFKGSNTRNSDLYRLIKGAVGE